jgi:superfamily II DNA or RNA helicase
VRISAGASEAYLTEASDEETAWLKDFLTFTTVIWVRGKRRDNVKTYLGFRGRFPVGLVPMVARHGEAAGLTVDVTDTRTQSPGTWSGTPTPWLREYQQDAVERCMKRTRGVVSSPTGSGKGEMIVALTMQSHCRWLVLVHRDHLVEDLGERFASRSGESPGWCRRGMVDLDQRVTFATFQSFRTSMSDEFCDTVNGLIVDEAHTVAADTFSACAQSLRRTYYRFGFSGTPFDRTDARSIAVVAAVGPKIYTIKTQFLIDQGYIPRPIVRMVPCLQEGTNQAKYATVYKHTVEASRVRNGVCMEIIQAMDKPGIAFVRKRDHGLTLAALASDHGLNVTYVDGRSSKAQRTEAIKSVQRGATDVLLSTVVFQEGLDLPGLRSTANLAGGQSVIEILQRLGRGMRKQHDEDHTFQVWDIFDVVKRPVGSKRQKWLQKHSRSRAVAMAREGHQVVIGNPGEPGHVFDPDTRLGWDT